MTDLHPPMNAGVAPMDADKVKIDFAHGFIGVHRRASIGVLLSASIGGRVFDVFF
ncbi:MAG: hypothetical protein JNK75_02275 [Betaproteobacteria bacterium]|nr:hypothetical protein [Betaproteobacteria bacterium]